MRCQAFTTLLDPLWRGGIASGTRRPSDWLFQGAPPATEDLFDRTSTHRRRPTPGAPARGPGHRRGILCPAHLVLRAEVRGPQGGQLAHAAGPTSTAPTTIPSWCATRCRSGLKTMESLLATVPKHEGLLLTLCKGFTHLRLRVRAVRGRPAREQRLRARRRRCTSARSSSTCARAATGCAASSAALQGHRRSAAARPRDRRSARIQKRDLADALLDGGGLGLGHLARARTSPSCSPTCPRSARSSTRGLELDETLRGRRVPRGDDRARRAARGDGRLARRARASTSRAPWSCRTTARPAPYVTLAQSVSVLKQDRAEFRAPAREGAHVRSRERIPTQRLATIVIAAQGARAARSPGRVLPRRRRHHRSRHHHTQEKR